MVASSRLGFIESGNEVFQIQMHYNAERFDKVNSRLSISRFDFSIMSWLEVKSLDDHVLFLGKHTTASCSAAAMGLPRGCLFYIERADQSLYKFEVEDKSTTVILPCLKLPTPWISANWMMMPMTNMIRKIYTKDDNEKSMNVEEDQGKNSAVIEISEENKPWSIFNEKVDIVDVIASYLHPVDYGSFRSVCKTYRSKLPVQNRMKRSLLSSKTAYISPWLLISKENDTVYNFIDPMNNNDKYLMKLPELLVGAIIRFSKDGWLLMSKGERTLFFYNPFTREIIQLPDVPDDHYETNYIFCGISFSSLPTCSDCVVFAIAEWYPINEKVMVLVIKKVDNVWEPSKFEADCSCKFLACHNNPVFYKGNFYALDYNGTIGVLSLEDFNDQRNINSSDWKVLTKTLAQFDGVNPSYLVECEGELLLVNFERPFGKLVEIFKLDTCRMKWVKVKSLGNYSLFISHTSSFSVIAPKSSMSNKIYFSRLHGESERVLYYSLDTGNYHYIGSEQSSEDFYNTKSMVNCTWIEPNWSQNPPQEYP